jgi:uroporphyrinogen III methyltransferase/synthase
MTDSQELACELSSHGAIPLVFPLVSFAEPEDSGPLKKAIDELGQFDWLILTSVRAVRAVAGRASESGRFLRPAGSTWRAACVGPVTAEAARLAGFPVAHVAETHNGVALAEELGDRLRGTRVLLPRSDRANPDLPLALKEHGAQVTEVIAYCTLLPAALAQNELKRIVDGPSDAILFFSPSGVQHFAEIVGTPSFRALQDRLTITSVGPVTAKALGEAGVERVLVAADTTAAAVVQALERHFAAQKAAPAGAKQA